MQLNLLDLAEKDVLTKILEIFNSSTDLNAIIVDLEGSPIISKDNSLESCDFCKIMRKDPKVKRRCSESYARAGKLAASISEPYIFRCPAGLIEWAAPILSKGEHLGTIICGRVLMWEPEDFFWVELSMMNKQYDIDMAKLIAAAQSLPVISGKKVQASADLLFIMANYIVETSISGMDQQRKLQQQSALLKEEIKNRKKLENVIKKQNHIVKQVIEYIETNYYLNLKLEDIAGVVHLSSYYLSHLFKEETGSTIVEYLTKVRIEEAKKLLKNSLKSVQEVAQNTGFNNPSYFSKMFREKEGLTPLQYRQRQDE